MPQNVLDFDVSQFSTFGDASLSSGPVDLDAPEAQEVLDRERFERMGLLMPGGGFTPEGQAFAKNLEGTEHPDELINWHERGLIDINLQPTEKARIFQQGRAEVIRNGVDYWKDWNALGFEDDHKKENPGLGFWETVGATVGAFAKDIIPGAADYVGRSLRYTPGEILLRGMPDDETRALDKIAGGEFLKTSHANKTFIAKGAEKLGKQLFATDPEANQRAEYEFLLAQQDAEDLSQGEALGALGAVLPWVSDETVVDLMGTTDEQMAAGLPEDGVRKSVRAGQGAGELLDPIEMASGALTGYAANSLKLGAMTMSKTARAGQTVAKLQAKEIADKAALRSLKSSKIPPKGMTYAQRGQAIRRLTRGLDETAKEMADAQARLSALQERSLVYGGLQRVKDAGRASLGRPAAFAGKVAEKVGGAISESPLAQGISNVAAIGAGAAGLTGALPLMPAFAAAAALSAKGRGLRALGNTVRVLGDEFVKRRGTIPYWRRVAKAGKQNPVLARTSTLEAFAPLVDLTKELGKVATKGTLSEAPLNYIASGGGDQWLAESLGEALVFGAPGRVIGSVGQLAGMPAVGTRADFQAMQVADSVELRKTLPESQQAIFDKLPAAVRLSLGTYQAHMPDVTFELADTGTSERGGGGSWNATTRTIRIDAASQNPLAPLIAHEVSHALQDMGLRDLTIAELVGPGGYLVNDKGELKPDVAKFKSEYEKRIGRPITNEELALEWAAEALAPGISRAVGTGTLQAAIRKNPAGRRVVEALMSKSAFLRRFAGRTGILFDKNGKPIKGTGALGFKTSLPAPLMRAFDTELKATAGVSSEIGGKNARTPKISLDPNDPANASVVDDMGAQFEVDENGKVKRDRWGLPIALDKETLAARETIGKVMEEVALTRNLPEKPGGKGKSWVFGKDDYREVLRLIKSRDAFNPQQLEGLKQVINALEAGNGESFLAMYQKVYKARGKNKRIAVKGGVSPQWRVFVPFQLTVTKEGNLLIEAFDPQQLESNIAKVSGTAIAQELYDGDRGRMMRDVMEMAENQRKINRGEANEDVNLTRFGERKLGFLNAVFGDMGTRQKAKNQAFLKLPVFRTLPSSAKSWRLDRINKMAPTGAANLPAQMDRLQNRQLPDPVTPAMDAAYMQAVKAGDMETAQRMVDEAAKAAGYDVEAWKGYSDQPNRITWPPEKAANQPPENFQRINVLRRPTPFPTYDPGNTEPEVRIAAFFAEDKKVAQRFREGFGDESGVLGRFFLNLGKSKVFDGKGVEPAGNLQFFQSGKPFRDAIRSGDFDSVELRNTKDEGNVFITLEPGQSKSADPITYDDAGNVVPLSVRFNPKSDDIRYLPEPVFHGTEKIGDGEGDATILEENGKPVNLAAATMSITPEQDARYLDLAKDPEGNAEELQAMVDEAILAKIPAQKEGEYHLVKTTSLRAKRSPVFLRHGDGFVAFAHKAMVRSGTWRRIGFRYFEEIFWPFPKNEYLRATDNKEDYAHLKNGTHRGSFNHNVQEWEAPEEEGGLSVARDLEFPAEYAYFVTGEEVGQGTDGEPLLDLATARPKGKLLTYEVAQRILTKKRGKKPRFPNKSGESEVESADPITRDASGNVVPLSKRFNLQSMRAEQGGD